MVIFGAMMQMLKAIKMTFNDCQVAIETTYSFYWPQRMKPNDEPSEIQKHHDSSRNEINQNIQPLLA